MAHRNYIGLRLALVTAGVFCLPAPGRAQAGFTARITFSGYDKPEILTNFPALVVLGTNVENFSYSQFASPADGADLRFRNDSQSQYLNYEIERWDTNAVLDPAGIPGCVMWLKADAGVQTNASGGVTNWIDQTGNGHGVRQGGQIIPTYVPGVLNGKPVVRFYGTNGLDASGNLGMPTDTPRTIFLVVRPAAGHGNSEVFGTATGQMLDFGTWSQTNRLRLRDDGHGGNLFTGAGSVPLGTWHIVCVAADSGGTRVSSDGTETTNVITKHFHYALNTNYRLGWTDFPGRNYFGDIAEAILFTNALSDAEQRQIGWYLSAKYAIPAYGEPGKSHVWVQVPVISGSNTFIWALWGDPDDTNPPACTTNGATWSEGYEAVWHLRETGFPYADSRTYHPGSAGDPPALVAGGRTGGAGAFNGVNDNIRVGTIDLGERMTMSAWVNVADNATNIQTILSSKMGGLTNNGISFLINAYQTQNQQLRLDSGNGAGGIAAMTFSNLVTYGRWHHVAAAIDRPAGAAKLYVDGVDQTSAGTIQNDFGANLTIHIGQYTNNLYRFSGVLDECRISVVERSSNWIWACWMNQGSNDLFNACGKVMRTSRGTTLLIRREDRRSFFTSRRHI